MTSRSQLPPTAPQQYQGAGRLQFLQKIPVLNRLGLNSIGTKLFISVMGSTLIGIGGIALLFGEIVKYQTEDEIQRALTDRVQILDSHLAQAELYAETVGTSLLTLNLRQVNSAETYRRLIFELFKDRPDFVVGLGFGQRENGILPQERWFFPYYSLDTGNPDAPGLQLSAPYDNIRYLDGTQADAFYPETDRYQDYFLPQEDAWALSENEAANDQIAATYYSQIFNNENWLGTVFVDVDRTVITDILSDPVLYQSGSVALLTTNGQILSAPAISADDSTATSYQSIPGLEAVWSQMRQESGFIEGRQEYWAYAQVPEKDWILVASVPYTAVFQQVMLITVGGTLVVGTLLALIVFLVVRSLNRRLRPILQECYQFAANDAELLELLRYQDEVGRLSVSFFNLLEQIRLNQEQMRQEVTRMVQTEERLKQTEVAKRESQLLQADVENLLSVMSAVEAGNLTIEAQSSDRITGLVAEVLNRLIERLEQLMAIVLQTSEQITQGSKCLEELAVTVVKNTNQHTQAANQVQTLLSNINQLSQDTAVQAIATGEAVQLTQSAIHQGQQEMTTISKGIGVLQQSTEQIAKRTQTLTSYVELAAQFAKDQKRIASMTRILAVNASMLANRASIQQDPEQFASITREFETVAAQVNDLAAQTNQSLILLQQRTDQIQTVVSGLDHDVQEIGQQVNDFTIGIDQSRQVFSTIQAATERMAKMGQRIMQSSRVIVDATQSSLQIAHTISTIALETSGQIDTTRSQVKQIHELACLLHQNVEFFKLRSHSAAVLHPEPALLQLKDATQQGNPYVDSRS
ncbi:MAG: hypothetical protein Kow00121_46140 [Elainellaceae cyanobacterium]